MAILARYHGAKYVVELYFTRSIQLSIQAKASKTQENNNLDMTSSIITSGTQLPQPSASIPASPPPQTLKHVSDADGMVK